jgi:hypothetical protein
MGELIKGRSRPESPTTPSPIIDAGTPHPRSTGDEVPRHGFVPSYYVHPATAAWSLPTPPASRAVCSGWTRCIQHRARHEARRAGAPSEPGAGNVRNGPRTSAAERTPARSPHAWHKRDPAPRRPASSARSARRAPARPAPAHAIAGTAPHLKWRLVARSLTTALNTGPE